MESVIKGTNSQLSDRSYADHSWLMCYILKYQLVVQAYESYCPAETLALAYIACVCVCQLSEGLRTDLTAMNMWDDNLLIEKFSQKYKLMHLLNLIW
jgi:hypothetical protein